MERVPEKIKAKQLNLWEEMIYFNHLPFEDRLIAYIGSFCGYLVSLFLLDVNSAWIYIIKAIFGLIMSMIGLFLGLAVKDFYKLTKEYFKPKIVSATNKIFKHGKAKNDNERAA